MQKSLQALLVLGLRFHCDEKMEAVASSQAQLFSRQPIAVVQIFHEMEWKWNDSTAGCWLLPADRGRRTWYAAATQPINKPVDGTIGSFLQRRHGTPRRCTLYKPPHWTPPSQCWNRYPTCTHVAGCLLLVASM